MTKPGPAISKRSSCAPSERAQLAAESLGDLARRRAEARREQQRGVRRVVAEVGARRTLQRDRAAPANAAEQSLGAGRAVPLAGFAEQLARGLQQRRAQRLQRCRSARRKRAVRGLLIAGRRLVHRFLLGDCDTSCVTDQDPGAERHINIHLSPEIMGGVYANFANVSHSDYEFTVTFARVDHEVEAEEVPGVVVSRVNISPRFMRELIDAMEDNYSKWRTREGIKNLPEYGGTEAGSEEE